MKKELKNSVLIVGSTEIGKCKEFNDLMDTYAPSFWLDGASSVEEIERKWKQAMEHGSKCLISTPLKLKEIPYSLVSNFEIIRDSEQKSKALDYLVSRKVDDLYSSAFLEVIAMYCEMYADEVLKAPIKMGEPNMKISKIQIDSLKKVAIFLEGVKQGRGGDILPLGNHDLEQIWITIGILAT